MFSIFQGFGWEEGIVVLLIALLLFGAKKLPEIGKGLGKGIREFKDATKGLADDVKEGMDDKPKPPASPPPPDQHQG